MMVSFTNLPILSWYQIGVGIRFEQLCVYPQKGWKNGEGGTDLNMFQ